MKVSGDGVVDVYGQTRACVWVSVKAYPLAEKIAPCCLSAKVGLAELQMAAVGCTERLLCESARMRSGSAGSLLTVYAAFVVCRTKSALYILGFRSE